MEPISLESWNAKHLHLPSAAIYCIWRSSTKATRPARELPLPKHAGRSTDRKKLYRQKGTGKARRGNKQSPLLRGGGKSFGPQPRDFSTKLNRKVYDLAWRTALSYRYRRGELIVTEDGMELPLPDDFLQLAAAGQLRRELEDSFVRKYVKQMMEALEWGKLNGRTTFITGDKRPNLFTSLELAGEDGRALTLEDVDVKDLLETGRIVIERAALREMIQRHQSDVVSNVVMNGLRKGKLPLGEVLLP